MLVKKIRLSNFKNFDEVEVDFREMNIIVGANAAGKSNLLQSLRFVRDIQNYGIENAISLQGGIEYLRNIKLKSNSIIKFYIEFLPIGGTILDRLSGDNFLGLRTQQISYYLELSIKGKNKYEIISENISYNTQIEEVPDSDEDPEAHYDPIKTYNKYDFTMSSSKGKISYENNTLGEDVTVTLSNGKEKTIDIEKLKPFIMPFEYFKDQFDSKKSMIEQFSFIIPRSVEDFKIYDFDLKNIKKPASITAKAQLEENGENLAIVLKNILDDKDNKRKFSNLMSDILPFVRSIDVEKSQDKSLFFKLKEVFNSATAIPSSLLSDGTISITSIVTALFFEDSRLAAFEEPENGIHPALIAKLMEFFYDVSKNKQIIITTHSPEILRHSKLDDLYLVSRDVEGYTSIKKPGDQDMVKAFLENELGIDQLFIQNLLDI